MVTKKLVYLQPSRGWMPLTKFHCTKIPIQIPMTENFEGLYPEDLSEFKQKVRACNLSPVMLLEEVFSRNH